MLVAGMEGAFSINDKPTMIALLEPKFLAITLKASPARRQR
jgi:hypothetical protein